jgi:hypothetical protein
MKNTISTIYGAYLQACQYFKQPFELTPFTTLNEKMGVLSGVQPYEGEMPSVGYVAIGNGGHKSVMSASGRPYTVGEQHSTTDASLFNMIPLVVRPLTADLTLAERLNYKIRVVKLHNGVWYAIYYVKVLDMSTARPKMTMNTRVNGQISSRPFVPDTTNLNPTPLVLTSTTPLVASGEYAAVNSVVDAIFSAAEIADIILGQTILEDNEGLAIISEIAVVSGIPRIVQGIGAGNTSIEYGDLVAAQVCGILNTYHSLPNSNSMVKESMVLGTSDPMLTNTGLTTSS